MTASSWGGLVTEVDVDVAVVQTLRTWLPMYLSRAEQERGLPIGTLARPKPESYANTLDDDEFLDHRLPAVIVTTAQMADVSKDGDGVHSAEFRTRVSVITRGRTSPETRAVTALFSACVRRVMVQQQQLGGFGAGVALNGGLLSPIDDQTDQGRYLAAGINDFVVYVDEVVRAGAGPYQPGEPGPYPDPDPDEPDEPWDPITDVGRVTVNVTEKET